MANLTKVDPSRAGVAGQGRVLPADDTPRHHAENEIADLRMENGELRHRIEELEQLFQSPEILEELFADRKREYESLLEEKSEVIRSLHVKLQQMQQAAPPPPPPAPPAPTATLAAATAAPPAAEAPTTGEASNGADAAHAADVLELQCQLEDERRQLKEDEEILMKQMREMELAMARDRAELARQRNDLQRLHNDLNRELEQSSRDAGLRERLLALARKGQEVAKPKASKPAVPGQAPASDSKKTNSGFFRRMFGS